MFLGHALVGINFDSPEISLPFKNRRSCVKLLVRSGRQGVASLVSPPPPPGPAPLTLLPALVFCVTA